MYSVETVPEQHMHQVWFGRHSLDDDDNNINVGTRIDYYHYALDVCVDAILKRLFSGVCVQVKTNIIHMPKQRTYERVSICLVFRRSHALQPSAPHFLPTLPAQRKQDTQMPKQNKQFPKTYYSQ